MFNDTKDVQIISAGRTVEASWKIPHNQVHSHRESTIIAKVFHVYASSSSRNQGPWTSMTFCEIFQEKQLTQLSYNKSLSCNLILSSSWHPKNHKWQRLQALFNQNQRHLNNYNKRTVYNTNTWQKRRCTLTNTEMYGLLIYKNHIFFWINLWYFITKPPLQKPTSERSHSFQQK